MSDETITVKQDWYDVSKYKDEICQFVTKKKVDLGSVLSIMQGNYVRLYRTVYSGTTESDVERFPHSAEMFKVYKAANIEASLSGYSALLEVDGEDAHSVLLAPELKKVMTKQFKSMSLLEKLSGDTLDDWILKGEAVAFIKLKTTNEQFRQKQTLYDKETGQDVASFKLVGDVQYKDIDIERIDPLDFFVDAYDYDKDPDGCTKIVRSWISAEELLTSDAYPLLTKEQKDTIISKNSKNGQGYPYIYSGSYTDESQSRTDKDRIEVLNFYGNYITTDNKVLKNIKATIVSGTIAKAEYNPVTTNRIIYAPYKVDRMTHRSISPLACVKPVNRLINRATDMFIKNLEDAAVPWLMYSKGAISPQDRKGIRDRKEIEYQATSQPPQFWTPPFTAGQGLDLLNLVLQENKNVLGINNYITGDGGGAVRTARETAALHQAANSRMRVETDVFSYRFMLPLFNRFYTFNRELALSLEQPLNDIYSDPTLKVSISTNASRADKEGELQRLMQMLQLPIAQMIFSNLAPDQVVLAVRYLMAKADLTDADNLLELVDDQGNTQTPMMGKDGKLLEGVLPSEGVPPQEETEQQQTPIQDMNMLNEQQGEM